MKDELLAYIKKTASMLGIDPDSVALEYPENPGHGDFSTNVALANAKILKTSPRALAERFVAELGSVGSKSIGPKSIGSKEKMPDFVESVEIAGAGFINFKIKDAALIDLAVKVVESGRNGSLKTEHFSQLKWARPNIVAGLAQTASSARPVTDVLIEYTDPNTFKVFHIGHLMSNAIGESLSRLIEASGARVTRLCYASDIGLHIAKSVWAMQKHATDIPTVGAPIREKTDFLGRMYVEGTEAYEADIAAKDDIDALNEIIYEKIEPRRLMLYMKRAGNGAWSISIFCTKDWELDSTRPYSKVRWPRSASRLSMISSRRECSKRAKEPSSSRVRNMVCTRASSSIPMACRPMRQKRWV